jgi:hypothetical protein
VVCWAPLALNNQRKPSRSGLNADVLEKYIDQLSSHIRKIQDEELMVTNQFSAALASLHSKSHEKRRLREDMARNVYQVRVLGGTGARSRLSANAPHRTRTNRKKLPRFARSARLIEKCFTTRRLNERS